MHLIALMLALAAAPRDGLPPGAGEPVAGRCHMGECEWFAELERVTVRQTRSARLVRVRLVGGRSSVAQGEDYSESWGPNAHLEWETEPYDRWLFCSNTMSAVIDGTERAYLVSFLAGATPPPLQTARRLYVHVCGREPAHSDGPTPAEIEIARPDAIFGLRRVVPNERMNGAHRVAPRRRRR